MKRSLFLFAILLYSANLILAQSPVYKVNGEGSTMYLGGSIHLLRSSDYPLPDAFYMAFEKSDVLVFETDIDKSNDPVMAQKLIGMATYPEGKSLKTVLSPEIYDQLSKACADRGLPLPGMVQFKPSMVLLTLTMVDLSKLGVTGDGVDKHFRDKARETEKKILFLEEVEYQMELIANMGEGNEDNFVRYSLQDLEEQKELFEDMIASWRDGTASQMIQHIDMFKTSYPELYQSLLINRNNNWIPPLESYLKTSDVEFVIVGAMHLHGPDGVLQQLKNKGYEVEQMN